MAYNSNIRHRRSIRLKGYDYSQAGLYFITICCADRICRFGKIENGKMILNEYGQIAHNEWMKTPELRSQTELDAFIVIPNHIHGILKINDIGRDVSNTLKDGSLIIQKGDCNPPIMQQGDGNSRVIQKGEFNSPLRSPSNTVGAIIRGYKSSVTNNLDYWDSTKNYGNVTFTNTSYATKNPTKSFQNTLLITPKNGEKINFTRNELSRKEC